MERFKAFVDKAGWIAFAVLLNAVWFGGLCRVFWRQGSSAAFDVTIGLSFVSIGILIWSILRQPKSNNKEKK